MTRTRIKDRIRAITSQHFVRVLVESQPSYQLGLSAYLDGSATVEVLHEWWRYATLHTAFGAPPLSYTPKQRQQNAGLEDLAMAAYVAESEPDRAEYAEQLVENGVNRLYEALSL